jgi:mevalonate kinase
MVTWEFPAKTFLLGEYAALADLGAILLTTTPGFKMTLTNAPGLSGIHPDSPAGQWWQRAGMDAHGLLWEDPFLPIGGLGASTAQFLGAYYAVAYLKNTPVIPEQLLTAYWSCAWSGQGVRPSGYDLLAQSMSGCVNIHRLHQRFESLAWNFDDLTFLLVPTGHKLATHQHLIAAAIPPNVEALDRLVTMATTAFIHKDSGALIDAVNGYHRCLAAAGLVHEVSLHFITALAVDPRVLAVKGCGALGADMLLLLITPAEEAAVRQRLQELDLSALDASV